MGYVIVGYDYHGIGILIVESMHFSCPLRRLLRPLSQYKSLKYTLDLS